MAQEDHYHICVCICTYKRPELLSDLLNGLKRQETGGRFTYSILVVDNDIRQSAAPVVAQFSKGTFINTTYCVEEKQNISLARNKAIENAAGDFLAFIDDDEIPKNDWLICLFKAIFRYKADAVLGPVVPFYRTRPPKWVTKADFYSRPAFSSGFRISWRSGRTGNLLLKRKMIQDAGVLFDPKFGSGGEDQDFTRRLMERGYVFVWCNEAKASELVPAHRWKRIFMLRRALLRGQVSIREPGSRWLHLVKGLIAISIYTLALPLLLILGHHMFMWYLIKIMDHSGRILAMLNLMIIKDNYITE